MAHLHVHVYADTDTGSDRLLEVELDRNHAGDEAGDVAATWLLLTMLTEARDALVAQSRDRRLAER